MDTKIVLHTFLFLFFLISVFCEHKLGRVKTIFIENRNKRNNNINGQLDDMWSSNNPR